MLDRTTGPRTASASPALSPFRERPAVALHHQIKEDLFLKLRSGDWPPGFELPSEEALCTHYRVSRGTVRRAVSDLVTEGYIERHRGRGSFVCSPKLESGVVGAYNRFSVVGPRLDPGGRVLFCRKARATRQVATVLRLDPGDAVWHFERVRFTEQQPVSLQTSFMPMAICPTLERKDLTRRHLVELLRETRGIHLGSAIEYVDPTVADGYAARHLGIKVGAPLFQIERTTFALGGDVVEYRHAVLRGDVYRYRIELR
ncbi:MAG: GntR family transcriptional regulator [Lautropia sp.]